MAWRFKPSKFKNAVGKPAKKDSWVQDLNVGSPICHGNIIACSASLVAFIQEGRGSNHVSITKQGEVGRIGNKIHAIRGHTSLISDIAFSPFDDGLIATGSFDSKVKIWSIPEDGLDSDVFDPYSTLHLNTEDSVQNVLFHPTVNYFLTSVHSSGFILWDILNEKNVFSSSNAEGLQSSCWDYEGQILATSGVDCLLKIWDPRKSGGPCEVVDGHSNHRDSRVLWLGSSGFLLSSAFSSSRERQIHVRDRRNLVEPIHSLELETSSGLVLPLYDPDTQMLFFAGKADSSLGFVEVKTSKPFLTDISKTLCDVPTKGVCLVPKRGLDVMQGEVNRILQLSTSVLVPISYQVPRKSYSEFHEDLFPATRGAVSGMVPDDWLKGLNKPVHLVSLNPNSRSQESSLVSHVHDLKSHIDKLLNKRKMSVGEYTPYSLATPQAESVNGSLSQANGSEMCRKLSKPLLGPRPFVRPRLSLSGASSMGLENGVENEKVTQSVDLHASIEAKPEAQPVPRKRQSSVPSVVYREPGLSTVTSLENDTIDTCNLSEQCVHNPEQKNQCDENELSRKSVNDILRQYEEKEKNCKSDTGEKIVQRKHSFKEGTKSGEVQIECKHSSSIGSKERQIEKTTSVDFNMKTKSDEKVLCDKNDIEDSKSPDQNNLGRKPSKRFGRVSKYRHLKGTPLPKSQHIENIRDVNRTLPVECDGLSSNTERIAVPLSGAGGKIAILELSKPGRLTGGILPSIVNGAKVMDFSWSPFSNHEIAVVCDDGKIRIWVVPENGLAEPTNQPHLCWPGHPEKIYIVKYHPTASGIIATSSHDLFVKIWNVEDQTEMIVLTEHVEQIFSIAWSPCGKYLATMSRDGMLRVFDPRLDDQSVRKSICHKGSRAGRVVWALNGRYLITSGFNKSSERLVTVFESKSLEQLNTLSLDVSPSILIPFYDEDSSTLFLAGKGDTSILSYEVSTDPPHFFMLSPHRSNNPHHALSALPKIACNVKEVEFFRFLRLVEHSIEPLSFTVPRVKSEYFQNDLFPDTCIKWEPCLTSGDWMNMKEAQPKYLSLKPPDMPAVYSSAVGGERKAIPAKKEIDCKASPMPVPAPRLRNDKQKQQEVETSLSHLIAVDLSLEQDYMDGVDEEEWD